MSDPAALFFFGLVVLVGGAELFTRGLAWLARAFGDGQAIDLFVVAAASSSAPVLAVCLASALSGYPRVALATVIGSNVANVGLVLGLAAVVRPLAAQMRVLRPGIAVHIAATLLVWFLARDGVISQVGGAWLLIAAVVVAAFAVRVSGKEKAPAPAAAPQAEPGVGWVGGALLLAGVAGLTGGAALVVRALGGLVHETNVGGVTVALTVIAPGITLRAVAAGVGNARRGEGDAVLGGVVGAGVLNLLLGLGLAALARPIPVSNRLLMNELPALALATLLLLPVLLNGLRVRRGEGYVLLAAYAGFLAWVLWGVR
ncbi:MAG: sodium:calcium antiporter [Gemmataceae bacterium]|nr:sodium:calcium antiporter [Gemmataceae bacterium]